MMIMSLEIALLFLPGLVIGITLHEFAHAWSASLLGDNYPRRQGRVSLNPFRHLSPLGTLAILLLPFGWGRPVIINLHNFRRPKSGYLLSSLAGPAANLVVVAACIGLMHLTRHSYALGPAWAPMVSRGHVLLMCVGMVNIMLAVLNLIPIPPLDGSKIWPCLIPGLKPGMKAKTTWLFVILLVVLMYTGTLDPALRFVMDRVQSVLPEPDTLLYREARAQGWQDANANRHADAERAFTRAIEINPYSADAYYGRATARAARGDWPGALADANQAIGRVHLIPEYYDLRAAILTELGNGPDANADRATAEDLRKRTGAESQPADDAPPPETE